jgi:hypothetical protein
MKQRRDDHPSTRDIEKDKRGWANDQAIENPKETERIETEKRQREEDQKETSEIERDKRGG